jgi:alpha-glucosidase
MEDGEILMKHNRRRAWAGTAWVLALLFLVPSLLSAQRAEPIGNVLDVRPTENGVVLRAERGLVSFTAYAPGIVRVRVARGEFARDFSYAVVLPPAAGLLRMTDEGGELVLRTEALRIRVSKSPLRIRFYDPAGKLLNEDDASLGVSWRGAEVTCYKKLFPDERFLGMGEKSGMLDRRGWKYVHWNTDHYSYGVEDDPLYASTPFYIGLHDTLVYGIYLDNTSRTFFDFGASTDNQFMFFGAPHGELDYYFMAGAGVADVLGEYTALTGRMTMPPLWSLGYQQSRWSYYPDAEVLRLARTFREKKIPADVIYLDIHYMDAYKIFTWNAERFPRPKWMIDSLRAMGFHVATIVDPGIKIDSAYFAYREGVEKGYFATYPGGKNYVGSVWPGRCHFPDFTNPEVRRWWGASFSRLVEPGVEGFWNDMNEPAAWGQNIPNLVELKGDGEPTTMGDAHNVYGLLMARSTFEGTKALLGGRRPFVLTRAAFSGIQRYSAIWTGDNVPSDDHMMLAVRLVNSMGLAGMAFAGSDIGGFAGDATPDLFSRWLSIGVYTPFFRNHKQYGMKAQEPWSMGEEVEKTSRAAIEQRYRLLPYIYSAFEQTARTGIPVARTLAIEFTRDEHVFWYKYQHQYLFGDHILVAPLKSTERYADVYLPAGVWYRMSDGRRYDGGRSIVVDAPVSDLPVFVRGGGVLPMQPLVQYAAESPGDTLELHVYFGTSPVTSSYYEDDGATYAFEQGAFHRRAIRFDPARREVTLGRAEGSYASRFTAVNMIFHGFPAGAAYRVNGKAAAARTWASTPNLAAVSVPFRSTNDAIILQWH